MTNSTASVRRIDVPDIKDEARGLSPVEIRVEDLYKSFGANHVLSGVNLTIRRGEIVAIVGGSGCGKTVLLDHVIGLMKPDKGRVWEADHESEGSPLVDLATLDDDQMDRLRIHWGVVFQRNALLSGTVEENISLPLELVKGLGKDEIRQRINRVLKSVGLNPDEVLSIKRDSLSGGMAKRIALARALALEPLLIFYDEPTTGLDPEHAKMIQDLIFNTHHRTNDEKRTTLIVTHDKDLLSRLHPRIVMLHEGIVFFDGEYAAFKESDSPVVRPYLELMPILHQRDLRE